ncbi:MAG TPA: hypothetical protein PK129_08890, partial [Cellvibrionaceae bacterium]|nr:hypothetical protein [Cellvibrionaceae bacterium]
AEYARVEMSSEPSHEESCIGFRPKNLIVPVIVHKCKTLIKPIQKCGIWPGIGVLASNQRAINSLLFFRRWPHQVLLAALISNVTIG